MMKKLFDFKENWINPFTWVILLLILMVGSCDDRVKDPDSSNVIVTMLRVERIEIQDG